MGAAFQTLKQAFNIKHGIDPRRNKPSARALGLPALAKGANKDRRVDLDKMIRDYWHLFGWDQDTGQPSEDVMQHLLVGETAN